MSLSSKLRKGSSRRSRHQPYDVSKIRPNGTSSESVSPRFPPIISTPVPEGSITLREVSLEKVQKQLPGFIPRNDLELLVLAATPDAVQIDKDDIYGSLDRHFATAYLEDSTFGAGLLDLGKELFGPWFDGSPEVVTGMKPHPRDKNPYIRVRPIPNSQYSIRVFPGCPYDRFFCIDLLLTSTGRPVKLPANYELWALPPADPMFPDIPMAPLEPHRRNCPEDDEKFVVHDGHRVVLKRAGQPDVRFTVPMRPHQVQAPVSPETIQLDFS
ncbi:hypothetical protein HGRIS_003841 [Hohenbuehelia grisea]|uniref:Uncharacterized protein n=1 Tax=Hohenbuehelia grisea TaxID=104357 RepID=A0ABR3JH03_9AGAR